MRWSSKLQILEDLHQLKVVKQRNAAAVRQTDLPPQSGSQSGQTGSAHDNLIWTLPAASTGTQSATPPESLWTPNAREHLDLPAQSA